MNRFNRSLQDKSIPNTNLDRLILCQCTSFSYVLLSDFVPTLESLDTLAREAMNDVNIGMKTVDDLYKQGETYASFERLQETYFSR
jgi:hypothetical protein